MTRTTPVRGDALLVVDVQEDFLPGGRLPVPHGNEVVAPLNRIIAAFSQAGLPIVATRDWHPPNHCSFIQQGGPWPVHCVAGSPGAAFAAGLRLPAKATIISKAMDSQQDAYSAFEGTGLAQWLRAANVGRVFVGGLATDYCVLQTVLDAQRLGFTAVLLQDAVRAVNVKPGDGEQALAQMLQSGATTRTVDPALGTV